MPTKFTFGTSAADTFTLADGRDVSVSYDNIAFGNGGQDAITGGTGNDWIWGSSADAANNTGPDTFLGGAGDDVIISWSNNSFLDGGTGNDIIIYSGPAPTATQAATLQGGDGNDQLWSLNGAVSYGGNGDDLLVGGGYLDGGFGNDLLIATTNNTTAYGSVGDDTLYAQTGVTGVTLNGGIGKDVIVGNGGNDKLIAGNDVVQDVLIGGPGKDEFDEGGIGNKIVEPASQNPQTYPDAANTDIIWNFQVGTDDLVIPTTAYYLSTLGPGNAGLSFVSTSGYNASLGLSGTAIRLEGLTGSGILSFHTYYDVAFLAGVTTDINALTAAGSLHFNDSVALL